MVKFIVTIRVGKGSTITYVEENTVKHQVYDIDVNVLIISLILHEIRGFAFLFSCELLHQFTVCEAIHRSNWVNIRRDSFAGKCIITGVFTYTMYLYLNIVPTITFNCILEKLLG